MYKFWVIVFVLICGCASTETNYFTYNDILPGEVKVVDSRTRLWESTHKSTSWRDENPPYTVHFQDEQANDAGISSVLTNPAESMVQHFTWGVTP